MNLNILNDFDDAINNNKIYRIINCTPYIFHMYQIIKATNLGIYVFFNKLFSLNSIEVIALLILIIKIL